MSLFATPPLDRRPVRKRPYSRNKPESATLCASSNVQAKLKAKRIVLLALSAALALAVASKVKNVQKELGVLFEACARNSILMN